MNTKFIAIGSRLMGDDSISLRVLESLKIKFEGKGLKVIIGETDIEYCINEMMDASMAIILDSTSFGINAGAISLKKLSDNIGLFNNKSYSQHGLNLVKLLILYKIKIPIYLIGIEIKEIKYNINLSDCMNYKFNNICRKVERITFSLI